MYAGCFLLRSWDEVIAKPPSLPSVLTQQRLKWTDLQLPQCKHTYSSFTACQRPPNSSPEGLQRVKKSPFHYERLFIKSALSAQEWEEIMFIRTNTGSCNRLNIPSWDDFSAAKKKKKVRTTGNYSFTTSCSGILKSFQNICFCVPKRKRPLMAGDSLMREIKVTFLAERVKAEEELFLMRGYEIPCNSSARKVQRHPSDQHSWGLWKGLWWVVSRASKPLKDGLPECLGINGTIKALGEVMRFFFNFQSCRVQESRVYLRNGEKWVAKINMFAFPKNILQVFWGGDKLSCCWVEKSQAFSSTNWSFCQMGLITAAFGALSLSCV